MAASPAATTTPDFVIPPNRTIITVCAMIATLMQALDSTIANVALPYMQGGLSTTSDQINWVLTSYIVAAAIMTPPIGWLAMRFGRKNFFLVCLVGFTLASMLCGVAQSLTQMVLFRLLQGVFGAALVPLSQSIMMDMYPASQRGQAMAIWGMGVMVGPILGPTLGGYLTDVFDWRWVFYINVPFGLMACTGIVMFMRETKRNATISFDVFGFLVLAIAIGALQLGLDRGEQKEWFSSGEIIAELVLGLLGLYLFVVHICLAEKPFLPLGLFKDLNFLSGMLVMFMVGMVLLASSALLAPYVQTMAGYPVREAGLLMVPRGLGTMVSMMIAGRLSSRMDPRLLMMFGIGDLVFTLWLMTGWTPAVSAMTLSIVGLVQGLGLGFIFIPMQVVAFATLPAQYRTDAAALFALVRNVGSAVGISVCSFLLAQNTQTMHAQIAELLTPFNRMLQSGGAALFYSMTSATGRAALNGEVTRQAMAISFIDDFKLMMWVSLPAAFIVLLMRRPPRPAATR